VVVKKAVVEPEESRRGMVFGMRKTPGGRAFVRVWVGFPRESISTTWW